MEFNKYTIVALAHILILVPIIFYIGLKAAYGIPFNSGESQLILMTALFTALYHANNIRILEPTMTIIAILVTVGLCWIIWKSMPLQVDDRKLS